MKNSWLVTLGSLACLLGSPALGQAISGGSCSASNLNGKYSLVLSGRGISAAGNFSGSFQGNGTATFDGQSKVTLTGTYNTNLATKQSFTYSGTYTVPSNCYGTVTLTQGSAATFALVVWSDGTQYNMTGSDATYVYSGSGASNFAPGCSNATLSGAYTFEVTGFTVSGTTQNGVGEAAGVYQFDGQGNVTGTSVYTATGTAATTVTSTGTYTVSSSCLATATLSDSAGTSQSLNMVLVGDYGQNVDVIASGPVFVRTGTAHSAFTNPTQAIGNVASYGVNATPPGSVFALFGVNTATKPVSATVVPLPTTLLNTTVTVNGLAVPLFYADTQQIDAQMPWEIPGNAVATVIVKNGNSTSNAAAVWVPATGTPGISVYGNNRAVVVNKDNITVNGPSSPAAVNDEVVVYFTGGGPVTAAGKLTTGAGAPAGLSPITGTYSITVGGQKATVDYIGLTSGAIGLYQANFVVPPLAAAGAYPVVITIAGQASNNPVMNVVLH